jgi:hypothetical protein
VVVAMVAVASQHPKGSDDPERVERRPRHATPKVTA